MCDNAREEHSKEIEAEGDLVKPLSYQKDFSSTDYEGKEAKDQAAGHASDLIGRNQCFEQLL
jgi:hypothetical protein